MLYLIMFVYMLLLPTVMIALLYRIMDKIEELNKNKNQETKQIRKHPTIEKSNYENAFGGRKAYEIYQNKSGLYEPQRPSKGIELKKEE